MRHAFKVHACMAKLLGARSSRMCPTLGAHLCAHRRCGGDGYAAELQPFHIKRAQVGEHVGRLHASHATIGAQGGDVRACASGDCARINECCLRRSTRWWWAGLERSLPGCAGGHGRALSALCLVASVVMGGP